MKESRKIFIVGNSRSGTTMMGRVLSGHEYVYTFHELHFFEQLWSPTEMNKKISYGEACSLFAKLTCIERKGYLSDCSDYMQYKLESKEIITTSLSKSDVFSEFLSHESKKNNKFIPCDQTPRNLFYCKEIIELYPDAKIIYMVRDPRDVLLSQKNKWKRRFLGAKSIPLKEVIRAWANYHPITISKLWKASVNSMKPFENSTSVKKVYFEEFLQTPEKILKDICNFVGIEYTEEMLNIPQVGSSSGHDKPSKKGVDKNKMNGYGQGNLTNIELNVCESILHESMLYHGYKL